MSRTLPCRSGRRSASVVWRTGEASGNKFPCRRKASPHLTRVRPQLTTTTCGARGIVEATQPCMRFPFRTVTVVAAAVALLALFLRNVDLWRVGADIARALPEWLLVSLATMLLNVSIRAYRWQYLLE